MSRTQTFKESRVVGLRRYAIVCLLLLPGLARADEVTAEHAQALQLRLQSWLSGLLGSSVPTLPWRITAEDDHYLITWPIRGLDQPAGEVVTTATIEPLDATRWAIDRIDLPPSATLTLNIPPSAGLLNDGPVTISYSVGHQNTHGVIDVSLATASMLHSEADDLVVTSDAGGMHQEQHSDRYLADLALTPTQNGSLDFSLDGAVTGWKTASQSKDGTPMAVSIQTMHTTGKVSGIARERVADLLSATRDLAGALPTDALTKPDAESLPPQVRAQLRLVITALDGVMTGMSLEDTVDGFHLQGAGLGRLGIKHLQLGFGGEAPDGKLHMWLDLGLAGLESSSLPSTITAYLPHHVELKPTISGIATKDLRKLALDATEPDAKSKLTLDFATILLRGDASLGLETLSFDLGPAQVEGSGQLIMLAPDKWHGEAHLSATGFDALIAEAGTDPQLRQAMPVLIMLQGLAQSDADRLVWNIVSDGTKVTVNGFDLPQLGGGDKPKRKQNQLPNR